MYRVMIVDDYAIIRDEMKKMMIERGFEVPLTAASAEEAVSLHDKNLVDVVLMDIEMETAYAGVKATERIIEKDPDASIIYLTSHEESDVIILSMATGAKDYLNKTMDAGEMETHIKDVLSGHAKLSSEVQNVLVGEYKRLRKSEEGLMYFIQHLSTLTPAEKELVACFLSGMKVKDIAAKRFVEPVTVKSQIRTLLSKTGCSRTGEIVSRIKALGLEKLF